MRLVLIFTLALGCQNDPAGMSLPKRDGGLQLEELDLATATGGDLAQQPAPDLAGRDLAARDLAMIGGGDMAMSGGTCAQAIASASWDFESGAQGFTHKASDGFDPFNDWPYDEWQLGTATTVGPMACHGGTQCWATHLTKNYVFCERGELHTPALDLSSCAGTMGLKFVFWQWYEFDEGTGYKDGGRVEMSGNGGTSWQAAGVTFVGPIDIQDSYGGAECNNSFNIPNFYVHGKYGYTGDSGGWVKVEADIPDAVRTSNFRVRFIYGTSVTIATTDQNVQRGATLPGWYLDDMSIVIQ